MSTRATMDREKSARPLSTRPPSAVPIPRTAALMSAASRPLTQQGLSGLRPTQTSGGMVKRIYHDKRYWMSLIQTRMNKIRGEMARIKKENEEFRMKTLNIEDLKRTAQEYAKKIEDHQEQLALYNHALEVQISKTKEEDLLAEMDQKKRQNEQKFKEIDNLFNEKLKLQEQIAKIEKELDKEKQIKNAIVEQLPDEDKEKYLVLAAENEKLVKGIKTMQAQLREHKEKLEGFKEVVDKSPEKQEVLQLLQEDQRLEAQKKELEAYLANTLTPDQQREALLQQVKQDKIDIETLSNTKKLLEEDIATKRVRLTELERELDGKDNARLKKHRELRERGEYMDDFINSFEEKAAGVRSKIEVSKNMVLVALEHVAGNIAELDLEEFGNVQVDASDQSMEAWNKRCSLLSSQLERLKSYKVKCETDIVNLKLKKTTMMDEIEDMQDIDRKREQMSSEKSSLIEEDAALKAKLESTQAAVAEVERQKADLMKRLEENPGYHEIVALEKEIEDLENKKREAEDILKAETGNSVIDELNRSVDELLQKRNEQLIANLKNKKN